MTPSRALPQLLTALLLHTIAAAQSPTITELERRLREPDLDALARIELVDSLLEVGPRGAIVVARAVSAAAGAATKAFESERRAATHRFEKVAERSIREASKGEAVEVERLRAEAAALRARPSLSEGEIRTVGDPAVARLRELLTVSVQQSIAIDDELAHAVEAVERRLDVYRDLRDGWDRAVAALTSDDAPDARLLKLDAPPDPEALERSFRDELELAARLATAASGVGAQIVRDNAAVAAELDRGEADGIFALNQLRLVLGLAPLRIDPRLCTAARDHSADMETLGFFSHTSPVPGKRTPGDRAARAGTSAGAENIARGHDDGPGAIQGWWYSPGHHRNMLGAHGRVGLGRSGASWTLMFGG